FELSTTTDVIAGVLQPGAIPGAAPSFSSRVGRTLSFLHQALGQELLVMAQFVGDLAGDAIVIAGAFKPVDENSEQAHGWSPFVHHASRIRATAPVSRRQLDVSASSCRRPLRVS